VGYKSNVPVTRVAIDKDDDTTAQRTTPLIRILLVVMQEYVCG
jgi:hypothetical protein